ncbi:hypothetical protein BDF20DRAFT_854938 [Mycotypha africana]|uniref:uncharacterized protein n=1 Tax=Mycotypha africana TaxID=64632 RepID=UPI0023005A23|nr:uncharacterized protein BDF20DRAFT_854938 [Mycotypha africana]KAI8988287.1 hypothetical protein BDF20DRAFT_854938 [Mycotypha africana]
MLFQTPLIRQFLNSFVSKLQSSVEPPAVVLDSNDSISYYEDSILSTSSSEEEEEEEFNFYRYAPSSIYSNESFTSYDLDCYEYQIYEDKKKKNSSLFEKTYVSFPQIDSFSTPTSNIAKREFFTMPEVVTATATPIFYTEPLPTSHNNNESIWNSSVVFNNILTNLYHLTC